MSASQPDLFGDQTRAREPLSDATLATVRARLHAALALVKAAATMPWTNRLVMIHQDNDFRFGKDMLPAEEGAALWAEFDVEMDRLYAVMNEGNEFHPDD